MKLYKRFFKRRIDVAVSGCALLVQYLPLYTPQQARRHKVRPGITGWAQCHGRADISAHGQATMPPFNGNN